MANLMSNYTNLQSQGNPVTILTIQITLSLVIILVCLIGLVGNTLIILILFFQIKLNQSTTYILNLAVADFLFLFGSCVVCLYMLCLLNGVRTTDESDRAIAKFGEFLNNFAFNASLFFLGTLSLERCLSVCFPLWYKCWRPKHLSAILCSVMWVLSLVIAILEHFLPLEYLPTVYIVTSVIFFTLTLIMIVSSVVLLIQIQKTSEQCRPLKLYVVVAVSVLNFLLSLLPSRILRLLFLFAIVPSNITAALTYFVITLCSAVNSAINPYIYIMVGRWKKSLSTSKALASAFKEDSDQASQQSNITTCSHMSDSAMKLELSSGDS